MSAQPEDMTGPRAAGPRPDEDRIVLDDPDVTEEPVAVQEPVAVPKPAVEVDPLAAEGPPADEEPAAAPLAEPATAEPLAEPLATEPPGPLGTPSASSGAALIDDRPDTTPAAALAEQQWPAILSMFVDDPRGAVERAAAAASEVAASLVATLEREQADLRASWARDADTERLRTALQRYRSFCGRLEGLA